MINPMIKRRGPTTMQSSQLPSQGGAHKTYKDEVEKHSLEQNFKILEQEWSFFKKINPGKSQCSADSDITDDYCQSAIESSPREVMSSSSSSQRLSSEGYLCNWSQNDRAAVEIIKDRRHAIQSGKLKGRRLLFEDLSSGEIEEDNGSESVQESEGGLVRTCGFDDNEDESLVENPKESLDSGFCYIYSSSQSGERVVVGREEAMETEKVEVKNGINGGMVGYKKIWLGVVIAWLGVTFALIIVSWRKFNGGYVEEVMLVPT